MVPSLKAIQIVFMMDVPDVRLEMWAVWLPHNVTAQLSSDIAQKSK